jgi:hypothetical protein
MTLQHVNAKLFVDGELGVDMQRFIEVFHRWVAEQSLDELLVDVADYRHVHHGPGVVLIGLEANYSMDHTAGRCGLVYNRKASLEGSNTDRFQQALSAAAKVCLLLEQKLPELRFSRKEFELFVNDRALAPNKPETYEACRPELEAFIRNGLGQSDFVLEHKSDPRQRFGITVKLAQPMDLPTLVAAHGPAHKEEPIPK